MYINIVRVLGSLALLSSIVPPVFKDTRTFTIYLCAALLLSALKIRLPGLTSSVSLNTIPMLAAAAELSPTEALIIGCAGTLMQSYWYAKKRPSWLRISFNVSVIALAMCSSGVVYRLIRSWPDAGPSVAFAALAVTFFIMDTLPVCIAIALTEKQRIVSIWRDIYSSSFPLFMVGAAAAGVYSASGQSKWIVCAAIFPVFYLVYHAYWLFLSKLQQEKNHAGESAALNLRTIEALVAAIGARDGASHHEDVLIQTLALGVATQLELPENELRALEAAALLRNIGKMAIPDHLLSTPGKLTDPEMEKVKRHPALGADILARVSFPFPVVPIVRACHEKWNGTGYPDGLKGDQIPMGARILSAVDVFVSMTSDRPYRPALPFDQALAELVSEANRSFDPAVVAALEAAEDELRSTIEKARKVSRETAETQFEPLESIAQARYENQMLAGTDNFLTLKESLSVFAIRLSRVVRFDTIAVFSQVGERLLPEYVSGEESKLLLSGEIAVGAGLSGRVAEKGKAVLNGDAAEDLAALKTTSQTRTQSRTKTKLQSALSVPIESALGRRGVLTLYSSGVNAFTDDDMRVLLAVRLKILDWELQSFASMAIMESAGTATQDESNATSLFNA